MKLYDVIIAFTIAISVTINVALITFSISEGHFSEDKPTVPSLFKIKCADTNGNITIDTEVNAYSFVADDLTFKFNRADGKYFVVSGFCRVEEQ